MRLSHSVFWRSGMAAASVLLALGACSDSNDPSSPTGPEPILAAEVFTMMEDAIQDEYHAEHVYLGVLEDFGEIQPFSQIVEAERRHAEALALLFRSYGRQVPESAWNMGNVPRFPSFPDACRAGVEAEELNIALYDGFLSRELPEDVERVFANLRAASLESHLPAFRLCAN